MLIKYIRTLNDRLLVFVPGAVEKENSELRETLSSLHTVIDIYKQAEIEAEEYENAEVEENDDIDYGLNQVVFQCESCEYRSNSQRGLNVHIGKKHKNENAIEKINLISL